LPIFGTLHPKKQESVSDAKREELKHIARRFAQFVGQFASLGHMNALLQKRPSLRRAR
jgi:hypothetical protein